MVCVDAYSTHLDQLLQREWLCALGNGGYASSTVCGLNTRKYHGLLVASMSPPVRRMVLLSRVEESVCSEGDWVDLAANQYPGAIYPRGFEHLRLFSDDPFPRWAYQSDQWTLEKRLRPVPGRNAVVLSYTLLGGGPGIEFSLRPLFALRGIHQLTDQFDASLDAQCVGERLYRVPASSRSPEVYFAHDGEFAASAHWYLNTVYQREADRGYDDREDLWSPGAIRWKLLPGQTVHFVCSDERVDLIDLLSELRQPSVRLTSESADMAGLQMLLAAAAAHVVRTQAGQPAIISGYPWHSVSGREAMAGFTGLLLVTQRLDEAKALLADFASLERQGLLPSHLAENGSGWVYDSADTALWFIHAVGEYLRYGGDERFARDRLLPTIGRIVTACRGGAGPLKADPDGLLRIEFHESIAPTWMNAIVAQRPLTPRHGRCVEINALWYNALIVAADLHRRGGSPGQAEDLLALAQTVRAAFNQLFWNASANCCYDVLTDHGPDASIRPNQLLAISLRHAVLDQTRWPAVLACVERHLLTQYGLRTLSSSDPQYRGRYAGPAHERDTASHQGSVFPWLIGHYATAILRHSADDAQSADRARKLLSPLLIRMRDEGMGQIGELCDGDAPHRPGGAITSALATAELLRCYAEDVLGLVPAPAKPEPPADDSRRGETITSMS